METANDRWNRCLLKSTLPVPLHGYPCHILPESTFELRCAALHAPSLPLLYHFFSKVKAFCCIIENCYRELCSHDTSPPWTVLVRGDFFMLRIKKSSLTRSAAAPLKIAIAYAGLRFCFAEFDLSGTHHMFPLPWSIRRDFRLWHDQRSECCRRQRLPNRSRPCCQG